MQQQDIIITLSVCAVIMATVFFEHRMQQVEEACARVQSYSNNGSQRAGKSEEMIGREQVDVEDTDERSERIEATMRRHKSNDLMEEELNQLSARKAVAFSVTIGHSLTDNETVSEVVIYDIVEINIGEGYDPTTGIFRVPETGAYAFQWTSVTIPGKWFETELNINGHQKRLNSCNNKGETASSNLSCTSMVITEAKEGDIVWIAKFGQDGDYLMEMYSSFSGWKIGELSKE